MRTERLSKEAAYAVASELMADRAHILARLTTPADVRLVAGGLKKAFAKRGIEIDAAAAEGIAEAIQDVMPAARDRASASKGLVLS